LVATREKAKEINQSFLNSLPLETKTFVGKYTGTELDINLHKAPFIELESIELKRDAKVMLIYNVNLKEGLVNGLVGKVSRFSQNGYPIVSFENGDDVEVKEITWEIEDSKGNPIFTFTQLPLQLAWATTIHKSQGCTFNTLHVDLSRCFAPGQAYVALSRVRSLEGLYLEPFSTSKIVTDTKMVAYYDSLEKEVIS
jgi:ATP-dependent exoDNAse (exonuclease V) alpha subunit